MTNLYLHLNHSGFMSKERPVTMSLSAEYSFDRLAVFNY